jgi:DNA replication protein DnaC
LDSFDFKAQPSLNKLLITELMRGEFIDRRENILLVGNSGVGKPQPAQYPASHPGMRR